jgi:hypothetical protein
MTTTTETPEAAIWTWLQGTPHFDCGGWSWDSRRPGVLECDCGEVLSMGADPASCRPSSVADMIVEWTNSDGTLNVEPGDLVLHAGRFEMVTSVERAEWVGERGRDGVRVGMTGVMLHCSFPADSLVAVRRYVEG